MKKNLGKSYKNLYFDLDRTLWDFHTNSEQTLFDLIEQYIPELMPRFSKFLEVYYSKNEELWRQYRDGELKKEILRTKRFNDSIEAMGIKNCKFINEISDGYINNSPYKTALFPHAIETLNYLKNKGYSMFLLTNGFLEVQVVKIRESKLEPYFEKMITSEEAGYQKPNKKIFEYALKTVNARKSESIMIGDDLENDIMGAKRFGIDTVFFNPEKNEQLIKSTFTIHDLEELKSIF